MDKMPVVEEYVEEINEDNGINEKDEDSEFKNDEENEPIHISPRPKMSKEEIFEVSSPRNKKVSNTPIKNEDNEKIVEKKTRKKRPPMSEEHKEKLRLAREKALETRRRNAQEKKEMKELEKKAKQKKKEELKKYVNDEPVEKPKKEIIREVKEVSSITKKDLEEAQLEAIMKYEAIRKQRKKEKQQKEREQKEKDKVKQQINNMVKPNKVFYGQQGYFDNCF